MGHTAYKHITITLNIKLKTRMECHLGMADVQVAIRFRGESGHDLATSGFQVCLQLSCCVGNAHLTTSGLRAESHHLVDLRTHTPLVETTTQAILLWTALFKSCFGLRLYTM